MNFSETLPELSPEVRQSILAATESILKEWIVDFATVDFDGDLSHAVDKHTSHLRKCVDSFESQSAFLKAMEEWITSPDYPKDLVDFKTALAAYAKREISAALVKSFEDLLMKHLCSK